MPESRAISSIVHTYAGSPLNRLSWLRPSHTFLNNIAAHPRTKWLLFKNGQPLTSVSSSSVPQLLFLTTETIRPLLGPEPYFGQGQRPGELVGTDEVCDEHVGNHSPNHACRHNNRVVFLGLHEDQGGESSLSLAELKDISLAMQKLQGTPYFAMDTAELLGSMSSDEIDSVIASALPLDGKAFNWAEPRSLMMTIDGFSAAIFASANSMLDWNRRNKFCPGCGSPTYSMWGGWKIACTSLLPWAKNDGKKPCPSSKGLNNYTHPRTDPVVIMIAIDETGTKVLLGHSRRHPITMYSALSGFVEPGESFEDAVVREMWEEAGVRVWNVNYHSSQPWPYPSSLMTGFYARADASKPIRIDLDNELVEARWFDKEEIRAVLNHPMGTRFAKGGPTSGNEPEFRLPPPAAIAGTLLRDWVEGKIRFDDQMRSPNL